MTQTHPPGWITNKQTRDDVETRLRFHNKQKKRGAVRWKRSWQKDTKIYRPHAAVIIDHRWFWWFTTLSINSAWHKSIFLLFLFECVRSWRRLFGWSSFNDINEDNRFCFDHREVDVGWPFPDHKTLNISRKTAQADFIDTFLKKSQEGGSFLLFCYAI